MNKEETLILNESDIALITTRMAFQIYEYFIEDSEIVIVGIKNGGYLFAKTLQNELQKISKLKIKLIEFTLDKENPKDSIFPDSKLFENKNIVLVDDVANSGKTLLYALKPFLDTNPQKIKVAILVDRKHKNFPIKADIVGERLSTTLQSTIKLKFHESGIPKGAYLLE